MDTNLYLCFYDLCYTRNNIVKVLVYNTLSESNKTELSKDPSDSFTWFANCPRDLLKRIQVMRFVWKYVLLIPIMSNIVHILITELK
jgi:hypothetical protein